jgi:hypothetical protein
MTRYPCTTISLTEWRCDHNFDRVRGEIDNPPVSTSPSRFRSRLLIAFLLLTTVILGLHVQLAKCDHPPTFAGGHILHGDLRPGGDRADQEITVAHHVAAIVFAVRRAQVVALSPAASGAIVPSIEPSVREFLSYLTLLLRPPPRPSFA